MKRINLFFVVFLLYFNPIYTFSQDSTHDKVVMLNGEEKIGQITEIGDTYVKFVYQNETLVYTLKKEEINKIQFASGRVEFITESTKSSGSDANQMQSHHNIVAILPFTYIGQGGSRDEKLELKVQSDCYNLLKKNASQFDIQDPMTTNATLIKHNINQGNMMGLTPGELANLLNAEYVVIGTVTINVEGATSTSGNYYTNKDKGKKNTGWILGSSTTSQNFETTVDMKIYTDQGQNIYAQSHQSFWPNENAYEVTLQYLIKRTPLYHK